MAFITRAPLCNPLIQFQSDMMEMQGLFMLQQFIRKKFLMVMVMGQCKPTSSNSHTFQLVAHKKDRDKTCNLVMVCPLIAFTMFFSQMQPQRDPNLIYEVHKRTTHVNLLVLQIKIGVPRLKEKIIIIRGVPRRFLVTKHGNLGDPIMWYSILLKNKTGLGLLSNFVKTGQGVQNPAKLISKLLIIVKKKKSNK